MSDLFQREQTNIVQPVTADKCKINWEGVIAAATNISISYQQGVQRRRTIGNKEAAIWATYPQGRVEIQRLIADTASEIFGKAAWNACTPGQLSFTLAGCGTAAGLTFTATGCVVTSYSVSAEAEGLTVIDNLAIEFLELTQG